jgi:HEAT repeat protein
MRTSPCFSRCLALLALPALLMTPALAGAPRETGAELIRRAVDPDSPLEGRLDALRRLEFAATADAAAALGPLLDDPAAHLLARRALTGMAEPAAGRALREALARSTDPLRTAGLMESLGLRRDAEAEALVAAKRDDADERVRRAAVRALGQIGTPSALRRLRERPSAAGDREVWEAAVLAAAQSNVGSTAAFDAWSRLRREGLPSSRGAATLALGRLGRLSPTQWAEALQDATPDVRAAAVALAASGIGGGRVPTPQLFDRLDPQTQAQLLEVLGERGPPAGLIALRRGLGSPHLTVRAAAARGLGERGDNDSTDALLSLAFADDSAGAAARGALRVLAVSRIDAALLAQVASGETRDRAWAIELLAARGHRPLLPLLLDARLLEEPKLRAATTEAVRQLAGDADVSALLAFALRLDAAPRGAVSGVVGQVIRRTDDPAGVVRSLDDTLGDAPPAVAAELMPLYALVPGPEPVASLLRRTAPGDRELRLAAVRALGRHGSPEALTALRTLVSDADLGAEARALLERRP